MRRCAVSSEGSTKVLYIGYTVSEICTSGCLQLLRAHRTCSSVSCTGQILHRIKPAAGLLLILG